jgi:hypothetical protein
MELEREQNEVIVTETKVGKKKNKKLGMFLKFLMYGGWMVILVVVLAIFIVTSMVGK